MAYVFIAPAMFLLLLFLIIPAFMALGFSFTDFYVLTPDKMEIVGIDNYITLVSYGFVYTTRMMVCSMRY